MDDAEFSWDDEKAEKNREKHGLSFQLVRRIFADSDRWEDLVVGQFEMFLLRFTLMPAMINWPHVEAIVLDVHGFHKPTHIGREASRMH